MRVLVARFSIMSLCVLAVSVGPARGQSPSLMSIPSPADIGTNNFVANFIDSANTGNVRVNMTNSFDSMHARFSDSGRGVASAYSRKYSGQVQRFNNEIHEYQFSNKALENTAAVYPSFVGVSSGFNSPLSAGASQNPPAAGAGQAPPPGTGAGQTPPPATGTAPDQSVTANIGSHLKIFGAVRLDVYYTTARTQGPGLPAFGSEVCRRVHGVHRGYQRSKFERWRCIHWIRYREVPFRRASVGGVFRQHQCVCRP
jgi:hypothetical protein